MIMKSDKNAHRKTAQQGSQSDYIVKFYIMQIDYATA